MVSSVLDVYLPPPLRPCCASERVQAANDGRCPSGNCRVPSNRAGSSASPRAHSREVHFHFSIAILFVTYSTAVPSSSHAIQSSPQSHSQFQPSGNPRVRLDCTSPSPLVPRAPSTRKNVNQTPPRRHERQRRRRRPRRSQR